ncbi:hypothetical protein EIQ19_17380 [Xanthomonas campestris pv. campestris]
METGPGALRTRGRQCLKRRVLPALSHCWQPQSIAAYGWGFSRHTCKNDSQARISPIASVS